MKQLQSSKATGPVRFVLRLFREEPAWLVILGAPLVYWWQSRSVTGPVYMQDEIGYLSNAAFLAGYRLDAASSFQAGYSLFLAPLFRLFSEPDRVWQGVMVVNGLLLCIALFTLSWLLRRWFPATPPLVRAGALLLTALYPAWVTMAGYAFANCAMVMVFMLSLAALDFWSPHLPHTIAPHALFVGFLYWIHPTGVAPIFASCLLVWFVAARGRHWASLALHALLVATLVVGYASLVQPWLVDAMTPPGHPALLHYPSLGVSAGKLAHSAARIRLVVFSLAQLSYLVVGTFGLAVAAAWYGGRRVFRTPLWGVESKAPRQSLSILYTLMSTTGVILLGALLFSAFPTAQLEQPIYGRYVDPVAVPLLAVGFLSVQDIPRRGRFLAGAIASAAVVVVGAMLLVVHDPGRANAIANTPGFWPQYILPSADYVIWMSLGALGVIAVAAGGRAAAIILMLGAYIVSQPAQAEFHRWAARKVDASSMIALLRANVPVGSCIAYDPLTRISPDFQELRFQLFKFYLFDYSYTRMTPDQWLDDCNGPLLTRSISRWEQDPRVQILVRDNASEIFLVTESGAPQFSFPAEVLRANDLYQASPERRNCLAAGCFSGIPAQLINYSQVGELIGSRLATTGRAGYLFFGPYFPLAHGRYLLRLTGDFTDVSWAYLDIVGGDSAEMLIGRFDLCPYGQGQDVEVLLPFELSQDISDLQIRLWVSAQDRLNIRGYEILSSLDDSAAEATAGLCVFGDRLSGQGHQVGSSVGNEWISDNRSGFLLFGPGVALPPGEYRLTVFGSSGTAAASFIDVVYDHARTRLLRLDLKSMASRDSSILAEGRLSVPEGVHDLEVRLRVGEQDDIRLGGYRLVPITP